MSTEGFAVELNNTRRLFGVDSTGVIGDCSSILIRGKAAAPILREDAAMSWIVNGFGGETCFEMGTDIGGGLKMSSLLSRAGNE